MRPTLAQRFFASDLPLRIVLLGASVALMASTAATLFPSLELRPAAVAAFVFYLAAAGLLGLLLALLGLFFFIGPFYHARGLRNGAPYRPGDHVMILAGRHRGRVVPVYAVWEERQQVRVELGDGEREAVEDVFSHVTVLRQSPPDKNAPAADAAQLPQPLSNSTHIG
jgi:hypothetical protein